MAARFADPGTYQADQMNEKADQRTRISFGRFLQKTRLEKRIRLTDVSQKTRIRTQILLAIEKEEHDKLPAATYVKGLLTAFAKAVGADTNEVLRRYEQDRQAFNEMARFQSGLTKSGAGDWLKLGCVLGLLLMLAALSIYLMTFVGGKMGPGAVSRGELTGETFGRTGSIKGSDESEDALSNGQDSHAEISKKAGNQTSVQGALKPKPDEKNTTLADDKNNATHRLNTDGYLLSIHAVKNTWLKVIADDQEVVKYRLKMGDRLDLTAVSRFNILIGNAEGVQLTLNDRPFPVSGKSGQIVNIEIP